MALVVKNPPAHTADIRDVSSVSGLGRSPGVGNGNPLQYSCQENSLGREAWLAIVHGVAKSVMTEHAHTQIGNQSITIVTVNTLDPCFPFHIGNAVPFSIESLKLVLSHILKASTQNYKATLTSLVFEEISGLSQFCFTIIL